MSKVPNFKTPCDTLIDELNKGEPNNQLIINISDVLEPEDMESDGDTLIRTFCENIRKLNGNTILHVIHNISSEINRGQYIIIIDNAIKNNQLNVIKFILKNFYLTYDTQIEVLYEIDQYGYRVLIYDGLKFYWDVHFNILLVKIMQYHAYDLEILQFLIDQNLGDYISTMLIFVDKSERDIFQLLLDNGADINYYSNYLIKKAYWNRDIDTIYYLLDNGANNKTIYNITYNPNVYYLGIVIYCAAYCVGAFWMAKMYS